MVSEDQFGSNVRHILIIEGNPDPSHERLSSALARAYHEGAEESDCMIQRINVGGIKFPILRTAKEFETEPKEEAIVDAQAAFLRAEHILFIFPLWLGGPPALLKAFMEEVARDHFLIRESGRGFPKGRLKGRSAELIVTMGMPPILYRMLFGAHGVKAFEKSILRMAGISPVRTTYFGGSAIAPPRVEALINRARRMGQRAGRRGR
jgi:putative NADPH-quinone reductase